MPLRKTHLIILLKPIDSDDFIKTVKKIKKRIENKANQDALESLLIILNKKVTISVDGKIIFLESHKIFIVRAMATTAGLIKKFW